MQTQKFVLTDEHITLLRNAYVRWEDCETGAPAIDCKRPYGNSDVAGDAAEILGYTLPDLDTPEGEDAWEALSAQLLETHRQTLTALQIILSTGIFTPGTYEAPAYTNDWRLTREG